MNELLSIGNLLYGGAAGLIVIGLFAVVARRHLIRVLLGVAVIEAGVNLMLVAAGFRPGAAAPIFDPQAISGPMVDPIPQALVLTAIVIGVAVLALGLTLAIRIHRQYGTLDTVALTRIVNAPAGSPESRAMMQRGGGGHES